MLEQKVMMETVVEVVYCQLETEKRLQEPSEGSE